MSWLMQGFIIAIFVILSGVFIRLGLILDEIKGENHKAPESGNCLNCYHQDNSVINEPCYSCITSENDYPNWESAKK